MVHVHRLTSTPGHGLIAVRPDGHVGFRCQITDANQLTAWLAHVMARVGRKSRAPGTFVSIPDALRGHVLGQEVRAFLRGSHRGTAA
jgi:hypothetical protein